MVEKLSEIHLKKGIKARQACHFYSIIRILSLFIPYFHLGFEQNSEKDEMILQ